MSYYYHFVCIQRGQNYWSKKEVDLTEFRFKDITKNPNHKEYKLPKKVTKELARLLGYIVAEGYMTSTSVIFSNKNETLLEQYSKYCKQLFDKRSKLSITKTVSNLRLDSIFLKQFLEYCGAKDIRSRGKVIPWTILQSPKNIVVEFLDVGGLTIVENLGGMESRVFQHELDHLNGITMKARWDEQEQTK